MRSKSRFASAHDHTEDATSNCTVFLNSQDFASDNSTDVNKHCRREIACSVNVNLRNSSLKNAQDCTDLGYTCRLLIVPSIRRRRDRPICLFNREYRLEVMLLKEKKFNSIYIIIALEVFIKPESWQHYLCRCLETIMFSGMQQYSFLTNHGASSFSTHDPIGNPILQWGAAASPELWTLR
ncbi:hypothetical protein RRG08_004550 [Elysia crispata]|uniref:Uncharacterized protein n=1 Tax=Elysia crispata TaxID=231223 RepID=A0AAE1B9Z0_9GAST|nr:hypothetical protein RRG08_004550 [Elysia crispata]